MLKTAYNLGVELAVKEAGMTMEDFEKLAFAAKLTQAVGKGVGGAGKSLSSTTKNIRDIYGKKEPSWISTQISKLFGKGKEVVKPTGGKPPGWKSQSRSTDPRQAKFKS